MMYGDVVGAFARSVVKAEKMLGAVAGEYEVWAFVEGHSDTSLGRGGPAGQAITSCLTVVIEHMCDLMVFRQGRLDYWLRFEESEGRNKMHEDRIGQKMATVRQWRKRYPSATLIGSE